MTWLDVAHPLGATAPVATTGQVIDAYTAGTIPPKLRRTVEAMFLRAALPALLATGSHATLPEMITAPDLRATWEELLP